MRFLHEQSIQRRSVHRDRSGAAGFALISVLIALSILLALLVPFLSSVLNEDKVSDHGIEEKYNQTGTTGLRDRLLFLAGLGDRSKEISTQGGTPDWDSLDEYPVNMPLPQAFGSGPATTLTSTSITDTQRMIHLPTSSPLVLGNLLGLCNLTLNNLAHLMLTLILKTFKQQLLRLTHIH